MRQKQLQLIITFHTTAAAIAMEKMCKSQGLPGRLIPVPREITAGCGMAWRAGVESRQLLADAVRNHAMDVDQYYEIMI